MGVMEAKLQEALGNVQRAEAEAANAGSLIAVLSYARAGVLCREVEGLIDQALIRESVELGKRLSGG